MNIATQTCTEFLEALASKAPVPGGGGASALVGAVGVALGNMVGNLTVGKKKYADVEADVRALDQRSEALRRKLEALVAADAEVFEPLSRAYGLPKDTEQQRSYKEQVMEQALNTACSVPMEIDGRPLRGDRTSPRLCAYGLCHCHLGCRRRRSLLQSGASRRQPECLYQHEVHGRPGEGPRSGGENRSHALQICSHGG